MKYILSILAAGLLSTTADAQNGFYLTAGAGAGTTNVKQSYSYTDITGSTITRSSLYSYNASLGVGYKFKNWRFQTGVQYLKTGYELNNLVFSRTFDPNQIIAVPSGDYRITYDHIGVPLQLGYTIAPSKKLSLVPYVGLLTTYNMGARSVISASGTETVNKWTSTAFDSRYNRISLWGTAALQLEYKVSNKVSITGGPSLQYMISNFEKRPSVIYQNQPRQRNYAISLNLGVNISL